MSIRGAERPIGSEGIAERSERRATTIGIGRHICGFCDKHYSRFPFPVPRSPLLAVKWKELGRDPKRNWGETPMALLFLVKKCVVLRSYRILRIQCGKF